MTAAMADWHKRRHQMRPIPAKHVFSLALFGTAGIVLAVSSIFHSQGLDQLTAFVGDGGDESGLFKKGLALL